MSYEAPNQNFAPSNTPNAKGEYGGNITQMVWQVRGRERQVYTLQYDFLNRMTEAHYAELNSIGGRTKDLDKYMEKLSYDARGNITHLTRNGQNASCGASLIDDLTYGYNTSGTNINRLNSVTDASDLTKGFKLKAGQAVGGTYTYDANGNMITDPNKGIVSILYNYLNLPEKITFNDGNIIAWLYDASGTKLKKTTTQVTANATTLALDGVPIANNIFTNGGLITSKGTVAANTNVTMIGGLGVELQPGFTAETGSTFLAYQNSGTMVNTQDYVGGFEYHNTILEAVYHSEGRVVPTTKNGILQYLYEYALKDHLGNTRVMFCDKDGSGTITQNSDQELNEVTQENHYYPFGLAMEGVWSNTPSITDNKYLYNGKELNDDFGLGWMDYGARMYDASVGRWNAVDPMATQYSEYSPYHYVRNNPINLIDPNGMYDASPTDSKNTWALGQDGSMVGGSGSHTEEAQSGGNSQSSGGDPVPNPRINNGNAHHENSNRFHSKRTNSDGSKRLHYGIDILVSKGTHLASILEGTVLSVNNSLEDGTKLPKMGNTIVIQSKDSKGKDVFIKYGHLDPSSANLHLQPGDQVSQGQTIGIAGNTGNLVDIPLEFKHVHIEAATSSEFLDTRIDPEIFIGTKFDSNGQPIPIPVKPEWHVNPALIMQDATKMTKVLFKPKA